jgi:hypothetical protein
MRGILAAFIGVSLAVSAPPAFAQSNNDDYTPLNSRIKRDRQFPTNLLNRWRNEMSPVSRARSRLMMTQFSKCLYSRSKSGALDLLGKTDYGFVDFGQIGLDADRTMRVYGFRDCLSRVANTHSSGVQLRFSAGALRQWLLQEAYFDRFDESPGWVQPGIVIASRDFPLSEQNPGVQAALDLADCVVAADPFTADFLFRTSGGTDEEKRALEQIVPLISPCVPANQRVQLDPALFRLWIGEALWHAANNSSAPAAGAGQDSE